VAQIGETPPHEKPHHHIYIITKGYKLAAYHVYILYLMLDVKFLNFVYQESLWSFQFLAAPLFFWLRLFDKLLLDVAKWE